MLSNRLLYNHILNIESIEFFQSQIVHLFWGLASWCGGIVPFVHTFHIRRRQNSMTFLCLAKTCRLDHDRQGNTFSHYCVAAFREPLQIDSPHRSCSENIFSYPLCNRLRLVIAPCMSIMFERFVSKNAKTHGKIIVLWYFIMAIR